MLLTSFLLMLLTRIMHLCVVDSVQHYVINQFQSLIWFFNLRLALLFMKPVLLTYKIWK